MKIKSISILRLTKNIMEFVSLIAMAAIFVFFAVIFNNYPADKTYYIMAFGRGFTIEKITLFAVFIICCGINGFLFLLSRFPTMYKYPVKITADNIEFQYHLSKIMLSAIQICVSILCGIIILLMYLSASRDVDFSPIPYIVTIGFIAVLFFILYLVLAKRYK